MFFLLIGDIQRTRLACASRTAAFTMVELLVACVVVSTLLFGIYAVFRHAMAVEATQWTRWNGHSAADAVAGHLAEALENAINLPGIPTISGGADAEGSGLFMECVVGPADDLDGHLGTSAVQRRRYSWDPNAEGARSGMLLLQVINYAGTRPLLPGLQPEDLSEPGFWQQVESRVIAEGLKGLSIHYKATDDPNAEWKGRWSGPTGKVAVQIRVTVGDQTIERIVVPRADSTALEL